jgi:hypothetical protein
MKVTQLQYELKAITFIPFILFSFLGWSETQSTLTEPTTGTIVPAMMSVERWVECLGRETEEPGDNLPQCCFFLHKSHMT